MSLGISREERVREMQDVYDLIIATCQEDPEFKAWGASALRFLNKRERESEPSPDVWEAMRKALAFYRDEWEQDVDAEQTVHGWTGTIGDTLPTEALYRDRGDAARKALALLPDPPKVTVEPQGDGR